jgi:TPR repeat protein
MAATFTSRGDAMLAIKDISAARKLYEQAANLGSAAAAKGLARTYDPAYADKLSIVGMRPDLAMAASWYDRAAALGDREAAKRVHELEAMLGAPPPAKTAP